MGGICRCTILSFIWGESHKGDYYDDNDLKYGIQFCEDYIAAGFTHEYHDKFNLRDYIKWAKKELLA